MDFKVVPTLSPSARDGRRIWVERQFSTGINGSSVSIQQLKEAVFAGAVPRIASPSLDRGKRSRENVAQIVACVENPICDHKGFEPEEPHHISHFRFDGGCSKGDTWKTRVVWRMKSVDSSTCDEMADLSRKWRVWQ